MDYNTQRSKLILPEYGRCIQDMVEYAMTIKDRDERLRCANTIIGLMANILKFDGEKEDFYQKLWNHLALMSGYKLDIDYPVEIQYADEQEQKRERVPYPQHKIKRRHYGLLVERLAKKLEDMEPGEKRTKLIELVANQMKRDLANWNANTLSDEKVVDDLADFTDQKIALLPSEINMMSDKQVLAEMQQTGSGKKKKKK